MQMSKNEITTVNTKSANTDLLTKPYFEQSSFKENNDYDLEGKLEIIDQLTKVSCNQTKSYSSLSKSKKIKEINDGIKIVGKGETGKNCGKFVPIRMCYHCGYPHFVKHTCGGSNGKRSCPNCSTTWLHHQAEKTFKRIISTELRSDIRKRSRLFYHDVFRKYRWIHSTISVKVVSSNADSIQEYRKEANKIAKEFGYKGYLLIFHPYRINKEGKKKFKKRWYDIREQENWKDYVNWAPHFHIIGYSGHRSPVWKGKTTQNKLLSGDQLNNDIWIAKRINDIENLDHLLILLNYLYSHCGITTTDSSRTLHTYTYGGKMSYRSLRHNDIKNGCDDLYNQIYLDVYDRVCGIEEEEGEWCFHCGSQDFVCLRQAEQFVLEFPDCPFNTLLTQIFEYMYSEGIDGAPPSRDLFNKEIKKLCKKVIFYEK